MGHTLMFRRAAADDVVALSELVNRAYRGEESRQGWTTEADLLDGQRISPDGVRELLRTPERMVIMAEDADALIGCFVFGADPDGSRDSYVGMIVVDPAKQAKGYGKALLAEAERLARIEGSPGLLMWVIKQRDALIEFYQRRGYEPTGVTHPFPYGHTEFGIPKRDDLGFVVLRKAL